MDGATQKANVCLLHLGNNQTLKWGGNDSLGEVELQRNTGQNSQKESKVQLGVGYIGNKVCIRITSLILASTRKAFCGTIIAVMGSDTYFKYFILNLRLA